MNLQSALGRSWYRLARAACWLNCKLLFRLRSVGTENVPREGAVVLVSNHQSHLDPVLLGVACPRPLRFLARESLFVWPLGPLIRSLGAIPIDREGAALSGLKSSLRVLKKGEILAMFPEGTRTIDGAIGPLKPGFAAVTRRGRATIVPVGLDGAFEALPRQRLRPRWVRIGVCFGTPLPAERAAELSDDELSAEVSRQLASCQAAAAELRGQPRRADKRAQMAKS